MIRALGRRRDAILQPVGCLRHQLLRVLSDLLLDMDEGLRVLTHESPSVRRGEMTPRVGETLLMRMVGRAKEDQGTCAAPSTTRMVRPNESRRIHQDSVTTPSVADRSCRKALMLRILRAAGAGPATLGACGNTKWRKL